MEGNQADPLPVLGELLGSVWRKDLFREMVGREL